ncbi:MAG: rod shape-determining protein RodA [Salinivirgaceae bacterium]
MFDQKNNILFKLDWLTIGLYLLLVLLGWFNIYSAVYTDEQALGFDFSSRYGRQLIWIMASAVILLLALILDSKFYSSFSYLLYALSILLLIAVLLFGTRINGAKSWFVIGPVRLQPAEFVKITTALALSKFLSSYNLKPEKFKTFLLVATIVLLPVVLILLQNDTGTALVFFIFFLVYFREGMPSVYLLIALLAVALFVLSLLYQNYLVVIILELLTFLAFYITYKRWKETLAGFFVLGSLTSIFWIAGGYFRPEISKTIFVLAALGIVTVGFIFQIYKHHLKGAFVILLMLFGSIAFTYSVDYVFDNALDNYQQRRIKVLLGIESDPYGAGYNVNQSMIAIGSGGPTGKGYLQGTQTKFKFVPEQSTDFIFCTVGEEWGFMGTATVLSLFLFLLLRLLKLAERQKSKFSRVFGYSVASILFFHIAINVGMTIGLAPVIGIPLPFFSYGGSSLWGFTFLLFIFLKLDANRNQLIT